MSVYIPGNRGHVNITIVICTERGNFFVVELLLMRISFFCQEDYDIDVAWQRGVALVSSAPMCLRTVCLLCASAGQHEVNNYIILQRSKCQIIHQTKCIQPSHRPKVG